MNRFIKKIVAPVVIASAMMGAVACGSHPDKTAIRDALSGCEGVELGDIDNISISFATIAGTNIIIGDNNVDGEVMSGSIATYDDENNISPLCHNVRHMVEYGR